MAQIRGTAGYHLGNQNNFGGGGNSSDATNDPSPLDAIREQTSKIEDLLDTWSEPIKPYVYYLQTAPLGWKGPLEYEPGTHSLTRVFVVDTYRTSAAS